MKDTSMNTHTDPFHGIKRYERELNRNDLIKEIIQFVENKSEAYDDSTIGHEFVTHYERQLPGIITSLSGNHSFLNSSDEENRRVIMEAVGNGVALKAGIVAAVLMLIYKIIRVITNNPSFTPSPGGGAGRGSPAYVQQATEELKTAHAEAAEALDKARQIIPVVTGNPSTRDDTSPQYVAADKAAHTLQTSVSTTMTEPNQPVKENANPFEVIRKTDSNLGATGLNTLPSFMVCKRREIFAEFIDSFSMTVIALNKYGPARLLQLVESIEAHCRAPKDAVFFTSPQFGSVFLPVLNVIGATIDLKIDGQVLSLQSLPVSDKKKQLYDKWLSTDYATAMENDPSLVLSVEEFVKDFADSEGNFATRSAKIAEFNQSFTDFLGSNEELKDSKYYSNLQHYINKFSEFKSEIANSPDVDNKDVVIQRINLTISILETYTKFLLANLCVLRRQTDKVDEFRKKNTESFTKIAKALNQFVDKAKGEQI